MADVRSMLRNELASRRATSQAGSAGTRVTKKRKLDTNDDIMRKKSRPTSPSAGPLPPDSKTPQPPSVQAAQEEEQQEEDRLANEVAGPGLPEQDAADENQREIPIIDSHAPAPPPAQAPADAPQTIDEDEWAAFEREVVAPTKVPQPPAAVSATATISAAPVSAAELEAQQRREKESLAKAREAEAEGEREDAARFIEEEFDQMEMLEDRVRRLKEKREELRRRKAAEAQEEGKKAEATAAEQPGGTESESEEEDEDWDDWRFR
ncbi:hypothetical protein VTN00DRAFT_5077 [Thermoascus crustaceus]|uniref:uncharacterized protein n=1 Tax=Thermoascus crustaceus TaxID=5088 RepID=UPI003741EBED